MLKSCHYCGKIHDSKFDCGKKPKPKRFVKEDEAGRYTWKFRMKSKEIKELSGYMCAVCKDQGHINYEDLEVHHIIKLTERPDLLTDDDNLICLCRFHHEQAESGQIDKKYLYSLVKMR